MKTINFLFQKNQVNISILIKKKYNLVLIYFISSFYFFALFFKSFESFLAWSFKSSDLSFASSFLAFASFFISYLRDLAYFLFFLFCSTLSYLCSVVFSF